LYPVYEVFRLLARHLQSSLVHLETTDDTSLAVLGLAGDSEVTVLVGNLRPSTTEFKVDGNGLCFAHEPFDVAAPERGLAGHTGAPERVGPVAGTVQLQPYEIAVITARRG
jgi:hypothetical protein